MFDKRHRITLLFNANKAYDRQVVEGVGEYLQASQSEWDIFIEEDLTLRNYLPMSMFRSSALGVPTIGSKIIPRYITLLPTTTRW